MSDPMADIVHDEDSAYGTTPAGILLKRLYEISSSHSLTLEMEKLLERIVVLEMFLEEEKSFEITKDEFEDFRARRLPDIREETKKLAAIIYGNVAHKEGG